MDILEAVLAVQARAQRLDLLAQSQVLQSAADGELQLLDMDGFRDVIVGSRPHRLHRGLNRPERGDHDDDELRVVRADSFQQLKTGHARHLQVGDDQLDRRSQKKFEGFPAGGGGQRLVTALLQLDLGHPAEAFVVVHYQNAIPLQCSLQGPDPLSAELSRDRFEG